MPAVGCWHRRDKKAKKILKSQYPQNAKTFCVVKSQYICVVKLCCKVTAYRLSLPQNFINILIHVSWHRRDKRTKTLESQRPTTLVLERHCNTLTFQNLYPDIAAIPGSLAAGITMEDLFCFIFVFLYLTLPRFLLRWLQHDNGRPVCVCVCVCVCACACVYIHTYINSRT